MSNLELVYTAVMWGFILIGLVNMDRFFKTKYPNWSTQRSGFTAIIVGGGIGYLAYIIFRLIMSII